MKMLVSRFLSVTLAVLFAGSFVCADTVDFTAYSNGTPDATGSFSYSSALNGQDINSYAELQAFSFTINNVTYNLNFVQTATQYVYFNYDTTTHMFVPGTSNGTTGPFPGVLTALTTPAISGFFLGGSLFLEYSTGYNADGTITFTYSTPNFTASNLTFNQQAVETNINTNISNPNMAGIVLALGVQSPSALPGAFNQLSPQAFGQFAGTTAFNDASFATEQKDNYLAGQRTGPNGTFIGGNGWIDASGLTVNDPSYDPSLSTVHSRLLAWNPAPYGHVVSDTPGSVLGGVTMKDPKEMKSTCCPAYSNPWNFYVQGDVVLSQGFSDPDVSHFDGNTESVRVGADYRLTPNFLIGLAAGYGHTDVTLDTDGSSATVDSYSPGFYASYADKGWYANLSGDYIHNAYTQSRVIGFLGQTATSAPEGNEGVVNLDGGYDFHRGAWTFGPLAGIQYTHLTIDGYSESGSLADLSVNNQDADSLRSRLGGRVSYAFSHCGINFTPHFDASWQHEFMDQSRGITSQFSNGGLGSFSVDTTKPSRDSALADVGLDAEINRTVTAFADYQVEAGQDNYFGQSVQGGVKIGF